MISSRKAAAGAAAFAAAVLVTGCAVQTYQPTSLNAHQSASLNAVDAAAAANTTPARKAPPSTVTPITMSAIGDPLVVDGSDDFQHINYDLLVTNAFPIPVRLTSLEVRDGNGAAVFSVQGAALDALTERNFTQAAIDPPAPIPVSSQVSVEVDVKLPKGTRVPRQLTHVIGWSVSTALPFIDGATSGEISGLALDVSRIKAEIISAPLKGDGWMSLQGCCLPNGHRSLRYAVDGSHEIKAEMFAVDWVGLANESIFTGDGSSNADYPYLGSDLLAVARGTVVKTRDGLPNETPFAPPKYVKTGQDYIGNSVVIQIAPNRYAIYGHIDPGTVAVKVGDRVKTGDVVGKLGNSGNSTSAHLHFVIADSPDFLTATSIPFVIDRWTLQGNAIVPDGPGPIPTTGPVVPQTRTHPLWHSVADFG